MQMERPYCCFLGSVQDPLPGEPEPEPVVEPDPAAAPEPLTPPVVPDEPLAVPDPLTVPPAAVAPFDELRLNDRADLCPRHGRSAHDNVACDIRAGFNYW